jgi:hypothetical protein
MKLPYTEKSEKYVGLYVIDFGDHSAVGYTAQEVATLLESERFSDVKVYKIHRAYPDGRMELHGVARERFQMESGMFFHGRDDADARRNFQRIHEWNIQQPPPCRTVVHLAGTSGKAAITALIYPAEYEQEMGEWLGESGITGNGPVDAGISQVNRYYQAGFEILDREQLWPAESQRDRDREELLKAVGESFQR